MESMLYEAALQGSVSTLLELLQQDPLILDRVSMNSLAEPPLHVASLLGHVDFVKEILRRKPALAEELDSRRSSALHIASQKGYVEIVKALLQVKPGTCFARDLDGRNPLHLAAMKGRIDVLGELIRSRPLAASATTIWGETILHLCVKHNQLEALKFLLKNMDNPEILNANDDYGMTILHLAVADKQVEVLKFLTTSTKIKVNALNANSLTALDILAQSKRDVKYWEIAELLRRAGSIRAKDIQLSANKLGIAQTKSLTTLENNLKQQGNGLECFHNKEDDWLEKKRNGIMVVASLIATMAFQAGVNPPGSPWQDTLSQSTIHRYNCFFVFNTTGFLASLSIILLLISGLPLKRRLFMWFLMVIMWVAVSAMAMTYMVSIDFLLESASLLPSGPYILTCVWFTIGGILFLGHTIRLIIKKKYFRKSIRRPCHFQAQDGHELPIASIV